MAAAVRFSGIKLGGALFISAFALTSCDDFEMPDFGLKKANTSEVSLDRSVKLIERDVEAPDVFQVTDMALWDGRPSLGGVWVAYPDQAQPERVIIRNEENGKFVIGALFKRERDNPGPLIQLSSDAAAALGILAGQPTRLNVTALRREQVPDETAQPVSDEAIAEETLDPISAAAAAIDAAEAKEAGTETSTAVATTPTPKPPTTSALDKPFIQIGIFSVETNATNTATSLRTLGLIPIVKAQESKGKKFWRVLVGPAATKSERASFLKKVKTLGFDDAYFVTN